MPHSARLNIVASIVAKPPRYRVGMASAYNTSFSALSTIEYRFVKNSEVLARKRQDSLRHLSAYRDNSVTFKILIFAPKKSLTNDLYLLG